MHTKIEILVEENWLGPHDRLDRMEKRVVE